MAGAKAKSDSGRVVAFVDGSNLFGGMAEMLNSGQYFNFSDFVGQLEQDFSLEKIYFYGTYMRHLSTDSKAKRTLALTQRKFFDSVKKNHKTIFYQGHFSKTTGKEKGVDVHLAIDMAVGAATDSYDEALIITGDDDLLYAIETAQRFNKKVHLVSLSSRLPLTIALKSQSSLLFDLDDHFKQKVLSKFSFLSSKVIVRRLAIEIKNITMPGTKGTGRVKKW